MEGTQNKRYTNDDLREMLEDLFNSRIIDSTQKEKFIDSLYKFHRKKLSSEEDRKLAQKRNATEYYYRKKLIKLYTNKNKL